MTPSYELGGGNACEFFCFFMCTYIFFAATVQLLSSTVSIYITTLFSPQHITALTLTCTSYHSDFYHHTIIFITTLSLTVTLPLISNTTPLLSTTINHHFPTAIQKSLFTTTIILSPCPTTTHSCPPSLLQSFTSTNYCMGVSSSSLTTVDCHCHSPPHITVFYHHTPS